MPRYTKLQNKTKRRYDPYRPLVSNKTIVAALKRKYEENRRKNLPNSRQGNGLENGEFGYFIEHGKKIPVLIKVQNIGNTMSEIKMKSFNGRIVYWNGSSKSKIEHILRKAKSNSGFRPRPITFM